jgi:hypothetical protein
VTVGQAQQGFTTLADSRQLFAQLPGEAGGQTLSTGQQIGAVFGTDNAARQRIEQQRAARLAQFGGATAATASRSGITGLGSATA